MVAWSPGFLMVANGFATPGVDSTIIQHQRIGQGSGVQTSEALTVKKAMLMALELITLEKKCRNSPKPFI
jgi:hypothetical protein